MENKYYEPDVEDFYVGMIYETEQDELRGIWEENTINTLRELEELCKYNSKYIGKYSNIRVKYLSKEDIESFGFKHLYDDFTFGEYFKSKCNIMNYNLNYDYLSNWLTISTVSKDDLIEYSTIFCGKILNKSEFKKLLIQLNIINE